jgi:hypothetical protein
MFGAQLVQLPRALRHLQPDNVRIDGAPP